MSTVIVGADPSVIVATGTQGPPGPKGERGDSVGRADIVASENLGGNRAVIINGGTAHYADNTDLTHANRVAGITVGAIEQGETGEFAEVGTLSGFSGLTPGQPVFLHADGIISHTLPTAGFLQQLGVAIAADAITIRIQPALILG